MTELLTAIAVKIEEHADSNGWDQPPRLYALVPTAELIANEPQVAEQFGLSVETTPPGSLTPIEQDDFPQGDLGDVLSGIAWPDSVAGCALVHEAVVLPPGAEENAPNGDDEEAVARWAADHPDRRDIRLTVAVLRDGSRGAAMRVRASADDEQDELVTDPDLAPNLAEALLATLQ